MRPFGMIATEDGLYLSRNLPDGWQDCQPEPEELVEGDYEEFADYCDESTDLSQWDRLGSLSDLI